MEGSADFTQRLLVVGISKPARQLLANGLQYLCSLLDENFKQILVDRLLVFGWWQQAGRDVLGWWIYGCDRCRHDLFQAERGLGLSNRRLSFAIFRQCHVRKIEFGNLCLAPVTQDGLIIHGQHLRRLDVVRQAEDDFFIIGQLLQRPFGPGLSFFVGAVGLRINAEQYLRLAHKPRLRRSLKFILGSRDELEFIRSQLLG